MQDVNALLNNWDKVTFNPTTTTLTLTPTTIAHGQNIVLAESDENKTVWSGQDGSANHRRVYHDLRTLGPTGVPPQNSTGNVSRLGLSWIFHGRDPQHACHCICTIASSMAYTVAFPKGARPCSNSAT